jgi:radical SAM protein with 4Fe4S-binding SPASM domain
MSYQLNPIYRLRKEENFVLLYKVDGENGTQIEQVTYLHPLPAIMLALFDGQKTKQDIIRQFSYICCLDEHLGEKIVEELIRQMNANIGGDLLIESYGISSQGALYDPVQFIIPSDKIKLKAIRLNAPLTLGYDVTHKCMRKCVYCYAENNFSPNFNHLPFDRVKEVLTEAKRIGVNGVIFGGGDPFARKDIINILEHTITLGLSHFISTKAFLTRRTCDRLKDIGLQRIQVSIDSADEQLADFMTGSKGYLDQATQTINNLHAVGIKVKCKAVVTSYNISGIPGLCNYLADLGVKHIQVASYGRSVYRHSDGLFAPVNDLNQLHDRLSSFKTIYPDVNLVDGGYASEEVDPIAEKQWGQFMERSLCTAGKHGLHILPDGKVIPCEQLPSQDAFVVGELSGQSLLEIWNSDRLRNWVFPDRELYKGTACYNCSRYMECTYGKGRCFRNAYAIFKTPFAPDPNCPNVQQRVRFS